MSHSIVAFSRTGFVRASVHMTVLSFRGQRLRCDMRLPCHGCTFRYRCLVLRRPCPGRRMPPLHLVLALPLLSVPPITGYERYQERGEGRDGRGEWPGVEESASWGRGRPRSPRGSRKLCGGVAMRRPLIVASRSPSPCWASSWPSWATPLPWWCSEMGRLGGQASEVCGGANRRWWACECAITVGGSAMRRRRHRCLWKLVEKFDHGRAFVYSF